MPDLPKLKQAAAIWPMAMLSLPMRVEKGPSVRPVAMLGRDEALMVTSFAPRPTFYTFDLQTGRHRALATAPKWADCGLCFEIMSVAVSRTRILWTAGIYRSERWNPGKRHVELWAMPRSHGPMKLVTWLTGHGEMPLEDRLTVVGEDAIWAGAGHAYSVPLGGGPVQTIDVPAQAEAVEIHGLRGTECGVEWCVGDVPADRYKVSKVAVLRRDGSGRREVVASSGHLLANGRFGLFGPPYIHGQRIEFTPREPAPQPVLYDRCANVMGRIGGLEKGEAMPEVSTGVAAEDMGPAEPILFWTTPKHKTWTVLDLSRIPGSVCTG